MDLKVNKLDLKEIDLDVYKITALSLQALRTFNICTISDSWWTDTSSFIPQGNGIVVDFCHHASKEYIADKTQIEGIRPVVYFHPIKTGKVTRMNTGDKFLLWNYIFRVFAPGIAICDTVIGYSALSKYNNNSDNFADTELCHAMEQWLEEAISFPMFLIKKETNYCLANAEFTVPSTEDELKYSISEFHYTEQPYWLRHRKDEFTGYCVDVDRSFKEADISKKLAVFPAVSYTAQNNLKRGDAIEYNGRLYAVFEDGFLLGLNTIGNSCYSTGIQEVVDMSTEEEFFKNSEIYKVLQHWIYRELSLNGTQ